MGRFDENTFTLICPKCDKIHQYNSLGEFHNRCMRDGFLASMVTQYKRNQSRLSNPSSRVSSRPSSSLSTTTPMSRLLIQESYLNNHHQLDSQCSIPINIKSSSVSQETKARTIVAKCRSCNIREELIVCSHCENVICMKCADEHQNVINDKVKREWNLCKNHYETILEQSGALIFIF